jgi:hypothetical protein
VVGILRGRMRARARTAPEAGIARPIDGQVGGALLAAPTGSTVASKERGRGDASTGRGAGLAGQLGLTSPVAQGVVALAVYLAVWILWRALPLVAHPWKAQLDPSSMDPSIFVWSLRWWPYALTHGLNPLHSVQLGAPAGYNLAWDTTVPPLALLAWPLTAAVGPVAAFNLLVGLSIPLSGWMAFVLCRRLTGQFWPALAAGFVYGFSAYEMNHVVAGQLDLAFSLLLPLMAYLVVAWRDGAIRAWAFVVLLALAMAALFYLFLETFAFLTAVGAVALLAGWALARRADRPQVARLAGLTGLAWLGSLVLAAPFLAAALAHVPASFHRHPGTTSIDLTGLVVPRRGQTFGLNWLGTAADHLKVASFDGYVGIPLLVLAVAFAVFCWSRRVTRFLTVLLIVVIVAALGPVLYVGGQQVTKLPWASLWQLPVVRGAFASRLMVFAFLILAVITALWLAGPARHRWVQVSRWGLAVLAIAAIAADVPTLSVNPSGTPAFIAAGQYRRYLAPGETVVVASAHGNVGMRWQADAGFYFRLAGGFVNAAFNGRTDLPAQVADLADHPVTPTAISSFRRYIATDKIGAILVDTGSTPKWSWKLRRVGLHPLRNGRPIGGVIIYLNRSVA